MKKRKQIKWKKYIPLVFGGAIGIAFGFFGGLYMDKAYEQWGRGAAFGLLAWFFAATYLHLIIHEGGHLVCGLLSGYKFLSFRVGSIILYRDGEKLKLGKYQLMGTGGQCLLAPPTPYKKSTPYLLYHAGGSLANLITALVALVGWRFTRDSFSANLFLIFALLGIVLGLMNGIPMHMGVDNDGMNIVTLRKNSVARYHMWIQMSIMAELSQGVRIKNMPIGWFIMPSSQAMKNPISAALGTFIFNRHMDRHNFERAKSVGERLLSTGILDIHRYFIYVELLYIELLGDCNEEKIKKIETENFKKFCKASKSNPSVCRMYYAYHSRYTMDETAAQKWKENFEKSIKKHPYAPEVEEERELFALVEKTSPPLARGTSPLRRGG